MKYDWSWAIYLQPEPGGTGTYLKYLIVGSLGSATLLYGLAFIYGGAASTDFEAIRAAASRPAPNRG